MSARIFVSVASYNDPHLFFTLRDCYAKAVEPARLVFAVVDQGRESQREALEALPFARQVRYVFVHWKETLGVSWARNLAFSLHDEEEFLLQIDAHTLFERSWDENLLRQNRLLTHQSNKPILSTYPQGFSFDRHGMPQYNEPSRQYALVLRPQVETVLDDEHAVLRFRARHVRSDRPVPGCHLAAGFVFCNARFIEEVPYDPYLYFHGEEQSLSVRAFTRGWDIYHPVDIPLYHFYRDESRGDTLHWRLPEREERALGYARLMERNEARLRRLVYGDGMVGSAYGLGTLRRLEDFAAFSGIDYRNRTIIDAAPKGAGVSRG